MRESHSVVPARLGTTSQPAELNALGHAHLKDLDRIRLLEALALAERSIGITEPNPRVGCILGFADGQVLGTGSTQPAGDSHAEVVALREARAAGHEVRGATAWVTLEPCSHQGRTPPCTGALIESGVHRVVYAVMDPNPKVSGLGVAQLRAAGVDVQEAASDIAQAARELNIGFFSRMERGRPWVRLKAAASLDGVSALHNGKSQWITSEAARNDGQAWRRRAGAVLTGIGTILADNPRLDVRSLAPSSQPMRVILDSSLRMPPKAATLGLPGKIVVVASGSNLRRSALEAAGAQLLVMPDKDCRVDLAEVIKWLGMQGVNEVHVEAGPKLNASLLQAKLIDELLLYLSPSFLGTGGQPIAALSQIDSLNSRIGLRIVDVTRIGDDLRILART